MFILLFGTDFGFYIQINKDLFSYGKLTSKFNPFLYLHNLTNVNDLVRHV